MSLSKTVKTFYERVGMKLKNVFLSDKVPSEPSPQSVQSQALDRYVNVCTDVAFVDSENRFVLAHRKISAAAGWWWKGGGMRKGETMEESIARIMMREIKFVPEGVKLLDHFFHMWETRAVAPQENGQHDLIFLHVVRASEETIAKIRLDPNEYDVEKGFMRYDGSQGVRPAVAAAYQEFKNQLYDGRLFI